MNVERIALAGWILECDPEMTRRLLTSLPEGASEACGCLHCRNFAAAREQVYGAEGRALLERLGIPLDREAEVYEIGPAERWGHRQYAGWFHAVGRVVRDPLVDKPPLGASFTQVGRSFRVFFTSKGSLIPEPLLLHPIVQLEFEAEVPWVLAEPTPDD